MLNITVVDFSLYRFDRSRSVDADLDVQDDSNDGIDSFFGRVNASCSGEMDNASV